MLLLVLVLSVVGVFYFLSSEEKQSAKPERRVNKPSSGKTDSEDDELFNTDLGDF